MRGLRTWGPGCLVQIPTVHRQLGDTQIGGNSPMRSWDLSGGPWVWRPVLGPRPRRLRPCPPLFTGSLRGTRKPPHLGSPSQESLQRLLSPTFDLGLERFEVSLGPKLSFIAGVGRGWRGSPRLLEGAEGTPSFERERLGQSRWNPGR